MVQFKISLYREILPGWNKGSNGHEDAKHRHGGCSPTSHNAIELRKFFYYPLETSPEAIEVSTRARRPPGILSSLRSSEPEILAEIKNIPLAFKQAKHIFHFRISKQGPISANLENLFFIFEFFAFFIVFAIIKFIYPIIKFVIFHNETFSKSIPQYIQTYFNK